MEAQRVLGSKEEISIETFFIIIFGLVIKILVDLLSVGLCFGAISKSLATVARAYPERIYCDAARS